MNYNYVYSIDRKGWCVYKTISELTMEYHSGPFETKEHAKSEAKRLEDLSA